MAAEFQSLNNEDTKENRKKLGLPLSKDLRYMKKTNCLWESHKVTNYEIVETLKPSGSHILKVSIDNGNVINIMADYFVEMQKPSFGQIESTEIEGIRGKCTETRPISYVVVDLETTGTNHCEDEIIEIGAVRYVKGIETERLSILVKTEKKLSKKVIELTGITNELLEKEGIESSDAANQLYSFLADDIIVGHNFASFDSYFIVDLFEKNLKHTLSNDFVDTLKLARNAYPELKHHKLQDMAEIYDIDYSKAHRAVVDCIINHYVYEFLAFGSLIYGEIDEEFKVHDKAEINDNVGKENDDEELVSLNLSDITGWKETLQNELSKLIEEYKLPDNSIALKGNIGKKKGDITSYSICIYEPDLIEDTADMTRNSIITRITEKDLKSSPEMVDIEPKNKNEFDILEAPFDAEVRRPLTTNPYMRISTNSNYFISYLVSSVKLAIENYTSKTAKFACCAKYLECSDAKKCVHSNLLYSKACEYRKNLENNRIFYGTNKNV